MSRSNKGNYVYRTGPASFKEGCEAIRDADMVGRSQWLSLWQLARDWNRARTMDWGEATELGVRAALFRQGKNPDVWA